MKMLTRNEWGCGVRLHGEARACLETLWGCFGLRLLVMPA